MNKTQGQNPIHILLIGSGRLAHHLQHWVSLSDQKIQLSTWDRHQDPQRIRTLIHSADLIWLAISDSAISSFYNQYIAGTDIPTVHFSGAFHDARIFSCHPLMTFGSEIYSDETYRKIIFAVTGQNQLDQLMPGFKNEFFILNPELKPLYHALCVVSGNFPQMLWNECAKISEQHQIPFSHFEQLVQFSMKNFFQHQTAALTGPLVRKDLQTLEKNQQALPEPLDSIYASFRKEFLK